MSVPAADDLRAWSRHNVDPLYDDVIIAAADLLEAIDDIVGRYAPRKIAALGEIDRLLHPEVQP